MSLLDTAMAGMNNPRRPNWEQQTLDDAVARVYDTRNRIAESIAQRTEAVNVRRQILIIRRQGSADRLAELEQQVLNARRWDAEAAQELIDFERVEAPQGDHPDDDVVRAYQQARDVLLALDPTHHALLDDQT